jgi:hypothetical protein
VNLFEHCSHSLRLRMLSESGVNLLSSTLLSVFWQNGHFTQQSPFLSAIHSQVTKTTTSCGLRRSNLLHMDFIYKHYRSLTYILRNIFSLCWPHFSVKQFHFLEEKRINGIK